MKTTKIKIRQRILVTFRLVLFISYLLTGIIFSIAVEIFPVGRYEHSHQLANFLARNQILLAILLMMFSVTLIATHLLASSITRPIEKLDKFALEIGKGNFIPNDFEFKEVELEDLNNALNQSVRQLGIYDNEQKTFFQNVSHELRTPLMSIQCYAEGIACGIMDPQQASATILQETEKLSELVTDLLYIAKIDNITTAYTKQEVDLIAVIHECANRQQAVASKKNIQFIFNFQAKVITFTGIKELLARAVDNLISNAIRYAKSRITLGCFQNGRQVKISVIDDGQGIEPEVMPHVFERFHKGSTGNTGIGLSIVNSIAKQHNGGVVAKNLDDGGAMFTITLEE